MTLLCNNKRYYFAIATTLLVALLSACTNTSVDKHNQNSAQTLDILKNERVVILGRRHLGDYETEADFVSCIGDRLDDLDTINVVPETKFVDQLYPWFEPRTAPLQLKRMATLMRDPLIAQQINNQGVHYMIWIDGNTETTDSQGSVSCSIGPSGGGCFGFASWDKVASYEAIIWDVNSLQEKGRIRVAAEGSSYMVAIVAPVPFIARVQAHACKELGKELQTFFAEG